MRNFVLGLSLFALPFTCYLYSVGRLYEFVIVSAAAAATLAWFIIVVVLLVSGICQINGDDVL